MTDPLSALIDRTATQLVEVVRGGPGSGHFGHEGRPGELGGSLPSTGPTGQTDFQGRPLGADRQIKGGNLTSQEAAIFDLALEHPFGGFDAAEIDAEALENLERAGLVKALPRIFKSSPRIYQVTTAGKDVQTQLFHVRRRIAREIEAQTRALPMAGETVDGLQVRKEVPNTASISASLSDWEELPGIRRVSMGAFQHGSDKPRFATVNDRHRAESLAQAIRSNRWIDPLIVVYDRDPTGPYILEGATRFDALRLLDARALPALVVLDRDPDTGLIARGGPGSGHFGHEGRPGEVGGSLPSGDAPLGRSELMPVARLALKYDDFENMERDWHVANFHGTYFHLTDDPNFQINPKQAPRDASSLAFGGNETPGLMVTTDIGNWADTLGPRPYVAIIELDRLEPNVDYKHTTRGFGHEIFIFKPGEASLVDVVPIEQAQAFSERLYDEIYPQSSNELRQIWEWAHANLKERSLAPTFRGGPGSGHHGHRGRPGKVGGSLPGGDAAIRPSASSKRKAFINQIRQGQWDYSMVGGMFEDPHKISRQNAGRWLVNEAGLDTTTAHRIVAGLEVIGMDATTNFVSATRLIQMAADEFASKLPGEPPAPLEQFDLLEETEFGLPIGQRADDVLDSLREIEAEIKDNDFETAFSVGPEDGVVRMRIRGQKSEVMFGDEEAARMRGSIMIHNHPSGSPPSSADFNYAVIQRIVESHIFHSSGRYVMRFNPNMGPNQRIRLQEAFSISYRRSKEMVDRMYNDGQIDDFQAWRLLMDGSFRNTEAIAPDLFDYVEEMT